MFAAAVKSFGTSVFPTNSLISPLFGLSLPCNTDVCSQPTLLTAHLLHCVAVSDDRDVELQPLGDQGPALPGQHPSLQEALGPADVGGGAAQAGHGAPGVRPGPGLTKLLTPLPTSLS